MKSILVLLSLISLACTQDPLELQELGQFSPNERECINQLRADANMITEALKQLYMPVNNTKFNEFMECTWRKDGFIDDHGNISLERFKYYVKGAYMDAVGIPELAEAFATDTINFCKDIREATAGQTGVQLMNCILGRLYA